MPNKNIKQIIFIVLLSVTICLQIFLIKKLDDISKRTVPLKNYVEITGDTIDHDQVEILTKIKDLHDR